jgi:hypothetical protein
MAEEMTTHKQKAARKNGNRQLKTLNEAAYKKVDEEAGQIVDALMSAARDGKVMSTRLLIELAEKCGDAEQAEVLQPFRALLLDLAAEPEWPAEALEALKEAESGQHGQLTA